MSKVIRIRKGLDISLKGHAEKVLVKSPMAPSYAIKPSDFHHLTPKLMVKEGDTVLAGTPLFVDKNRPEIIFASPVSGTVSAIIRGEKRKLLEVQVNPTAVQEYLPFDVPPAGHLSRTQVKEAMLKGGAWPFLKQRPYGILANPDDEPKAIFISGFDSAPLAPDVDFSLNGEGETFQVGIDTLSKLTDGRIYLGLNSEISATSILRKIKGVETNTFTGKHPAGNVGVQIHHISPVNKGEVVWTIDPQHVVSLGRLFLRGVYDVSKVVAVTGSEVRNPRYFRMIAGENIHALGGQFETVNNPRYISGNVLTGTNIGANGHLGFYDNAITVIPEGDHYEFLGWANPLRLKKYSVSRSYLSSLLPQRKYTLDTNLNGGERAFVMTGQYEKVLPMDIYPVYLLKAILADDIDKMEQLGIYEVIEEDLALCEFVCPSKTEVQAILRRGINTMLKEM